METDDGVEFTAFPYSDTVHPKTIRPIPPALRLYLRNVLRRVFLMPAPNYQFPPQLLVLRGMVPEFPKRTNHRRNCLRGALLRVR
jgi:hypothetical protein